jgi:hypothetical protein
MKQEGDSFGQKNEVAFLLEHLVLDFGANAKNWSPATQETTDANIRNVMHAYGVSCCLKQHRIWSLAYLFLLISSVERGIISFGY